MLRNLQFERDPDNRWYVVLPEWKGDRAALEMVAGADTMCDILAQGENKINVMIADEEIEESDKLHLIKECDLEDVSLGEGAYYNLFSLKGIEYDFQIWLCDVTKFVFGQFPKVIYIK